MNTAQVVGNLTRDLKIETVSGKPKVSGTIAINFGKNQTNYVRFEAWNKVAETLQNYCCKGSKVGLVGFLQSSNWTDQSNKQHYALVLSVNSVTLIAGRDSKERIPDEQDIAPGLPDDVVI